MNKYLAFFGSSHGFTSSIFDSNGITSEFKESIEERGLLESAVFTTDDTQNKEILARYIFKHNGKTFSLLKLYSFAQAANISRIDGCTIGVALISDGLVKISKTNLDLLRAAKDNFANLSLNGLKFNKSDFSQDVNRIWNAIVKSSSGNLLDKIELDSLTYNNNNTSTAYYLKKLFTDAEKLHTTVIKQNVVYFSEDFEHLKRAQKKWGKDEFPIYIEQNNQYLLYKEPTPAPQEPIQQKSSPKNNQQSETQITNPKLSSEDKIVESVEIASIKSELLESQTSNQFLQQKAEKLIQKNKLFRILVYILFIIISFFIFYIFFYKEKQLSEIDTPPVSDTVFIQKPNSIDFFINDSNKLDEGIDFLKGVQYIYKYNVKLQLLDSIKFHNQYKKIESLANKYNISIDSIKVRYDSKCNSITESKKIKGPIKIDVDSPKTNKSPR